MINLTQKQGMGNTMNVERLILKARIRRVEGECVHMSHQDVIPNGSFVIVRTEN